MKLILLSFGVKVKRAYCRGNFLATATHAQVVRRQFFVFQQDGTPAHRARDTVAFLSEKDALSSKRLCRCTRGTFRA